MESDFRIAVIGLGIIGGSVAYAAKGFKGGVVVGYDRNPEVRKTAADSGIFAEMCENAGDAIDGADLIVLATYPEGIVKTVADNRERFKKGAIITDVCGVKTGISAKMAEVIPDGVDYVGGHPMAGKEVDGFINASADMFEGCGFIITPSESSSEKSVKLVREMAEYMGAKRIAVATPELHDSTIAYTSDLMHIAASALCLNFHENMSLAYTAGAFRDCTRIALINPELWTELFMANATHTVEEIDKFINSLQALRDSIAEGDEEQLCSLLATVRKNKIEMQSRE